MTKHYGCLTESGVRLYATREQAENEAIDGIVAVFSEGEHWAGPLPRNGAKFYAHDQSTAQIMSALWLASDDDDADALREALDMD